VRTLNNNGAWCWFQGERAIIDSSGNLLVGSTPSTSGTAGVNRGGAVEVTTADASTLAVDRVDRVARAGRYRSDDHVSPGLLELPNGRIVASWAGHNDDRLKESATLDRSDTAWSVNASTSRGTSTSYSNLLRLSTENGGRGRIYDFYRAESQGVNALVSDDDGRTWRYAGLLVENSPKHPYTRFVSNGRDRIDFVSTTSNPQASRPSSVRSGYLKDGRIYRTDGVQIGTLGAGVDFSQLLPVDEGIAASREGLDTDVWTADMALSNGNPVALLTVKHPTSPGIPGRNHKQEYRYARWTGTRWQVTRLAWGGSELYTEQQSYSGNATFDQTDPRRVFLSSNVDPRTGGRLNSAADGQPHWEVYEASTTDQGATWAVRSVTSNSRVDNIRPVHASGHGRAALVWLRGTYTTFRDYDLDVVGVVDLVEGSSTRSVAGQRTRVARTSSTAAGRWTGTDSDGLFVVSSNLGGSGFLLPAGRNGARGFISVPLGRSYKPTAFDSDGDGREAVLLVDQSGSGENIVVEYREGGAVTTEDLVGPAGSSPVVGDFDGDGRDDIVWYAPGPAPDRLDRASGAQRRVPASGYFRSAVGDFDGDRRDDILWHAPGAERDYVWFGAAGGGFSSSEMVVQGSYRPVVADTNGDGRDDIVWQSGSLQVQSHLWTSKGRTFGSSQWGPASTVAVGGDFDGDGRDDLFFDRPGDTSDAWWWSSRR
jgi:hypothetical protein